MTHFLALLGGVAIGAGGTLFLIDRLIGKSFGAPKQ